MSKIAWHGELMLLKAEWNDKDGHMVNFKLVTTNEERPNPFKKFTKMRGGKAGSRFHMTAALIDVQGLAYDGEVMLARWGDTSTQGYTVGFWMEPPDHGYHPLDGYSRGVTSFMVALVELDDQTEEPIDQEQRDRVVDAEKPKTRGSYTSNAAHMLATNQQFWVYLNNTVIDANVNSYEGATMVIKQILGINSRKELDQNELKGTMFHDKVRRPFVEWSEG